MVTHKTECVKFQNMLPSFILPSFILPSFILPSYYIAISYYHILPSYLREFTGMLHLDGMKNPSSGWICITCKKLQDIWWCSRRPNWRLGACLFTGCWFGTFFIFHNIWDNPSHWLIFFKMVKTTNQFTVPITVYGVLEEREIAPSWWTVHRIRWFIDAHGRYIYSIHGVFGSNMQLQWCSEDSEKTRQYLLKEVMTVIRDDWMIELTLLLGNHHIPMYWALLSSM